MARPLRLSFNNAVYHITSRGNRRESIFYSKRDREVFLDKLNETFKKYSFICYAYCLMDNHYHLFIKTPLANLPQGMHYLNASYANWFKAKYKLEGVIFQGRYKAILVEEEKYALTLSAYIHLNPLRAGVVRNLEEYPWSSFLDYVGAKKRPVIEKLNLEFILNQFSNRLNQARKEYKKFVMENIEMESPFKNAFKGVVIGSESFIEEIKNRMKSQGENREIGETKFLEFYGVEDILRKISIHFGIKKEEIFKKRRGNVYRSLALYLLKEYTPLSLKEIGNLFEMDYTAVSQGVKRFKERIEKDRGISNLLKAMIQPLMSNVKT